MGGPSSRFGRPGQLARAARGSRSSSASLHRRKHRRALVLQEEHHELGGLGEAGVAADGVDVVGAFVEGLAGGQRDGLAAAQAHHDGAFEHVDEGVRVVAVHRVHRARRIFDGQHHRFLAGIVGQRLGHQRGDVRLGRGLLRAGGAGGQQQRDGERFECGHGLVPRRVGKCARPRVRTGRPCPGRTSCRGCRARSGSRR